MKSVLTFTFVFLTLVTYSQRDCSNTSTGLPPINDLGPDTYMGYQGGLYPGGTNNLPLTHKNHGYLLGKSIRPLDTLGNVDMENGAIVFAGFGASTAGNTFTQFKKQIKADTLNKYNKCLKFINMTFGGKGLETMEDTGVNWIWNAIRYVILEPEGFTHEQVQIAWIKSGSKTDTIVEFPLQANGIYEKYKSTVIRLKDSFPNLKLLYISSHAYGGYTGEFSDNVDIAGDPAAWHGGWSVKWLIEDQIEGDPAVRYGGPSPEAPWMAWGPYYWADGLTPRESDGLIWECDDFKDGDTGFHLSGQGLQKEVDMLIDFFWNDVISKTWFRNSGKWTACNSSSRNAAGEPYYIQQPDGQELYPSPNQGVFTYEPGDLNGAMTISVSNLNGVVVFSRNYDIQDGQVVTITLPDVPAGMYVLNASGHSGYDRRMFTVTQ